MPLPKIDLPLFELKLVSHPTPVKFRPFLVKEEKLLLMALQTEEETSILNAIKQVINNCLVAPSDLQIEKLPIFDIEYLFLNLRARSVGETAQTAYICRNITGTEKTEEGLEQPVECRNVMDVTVNLLEIQPINANQPSKIYLTKDIGIQLNYPTISSFKNIEEVVYSDDTAPIYDMVYDCVDYIYDADNVYYKNESSKEDFIEFMESLTQEQFDKIINFFVMLPKIKTEVNRTCEKCGFEHNLKLEGLSDFFT